jgi:hypothetical protein
MTWPAMRANEYPEMPTPHRPPIFPEAALKLCRVSGFSEAYWSHPVGSGQFEKDRNSQPVHAVAALIRAT